MTTLLYRTTLATLEVRDDGDGRTLAGLALPYGVEIDLGSYRESFAYGTAFADLDPAQVPLTATHATAPSCPSGSASSWPSSTTASTAPGGSARLSSATRSSS
jgi:hypothetical protein